MARKEHFVDPTFVMLHEMVKDGVHRKTCRSCVREGKLGLTLSGRLHEKCKVHPDEYLWLAGTPEEWERFRRYVRSFFNPASNWETVIPKPGKGRLSK